MARLVDASSVKTSANVPNSRDNLTVITIDDCPSKFLPYPKGSTISYNPFTFGELLKFNSSKLTQRQQIEFCLTGIHTDGFDKMKLAYFDYLWLSLLRKISTTSDSEFSSDFICNSCGHENHQVKKLEEINLSDIENVPALPVTIPVSDDDFLVVGPLTIQGYLDSLDIDENDDPNVSLYAHTVQNKSYKQAYDVIYNAKSETIDLLNYVDSLLDFGSAHASFKCVECGFENSGNLGDTINLVQPFRREIESLRNKLSFGGEGNNKPS